MSGRKRIKYPFAVTCIIISVSLAYVAFYYASELTAKRYRENRDIEAYSKYPYETVFTLSQVRQGQLNQALSGFCVPDVAVSIGALNLYVDSEESICWCKMYVQPPEEYPYRVVSGRMPELTSQNENQVVLGINKKKDTYRRDGRDYILICGEEYLVSAYVSAEDSAIHDNLVLLFWDAAGEKTRRTIEEFAALVFGIHIQLESNQDKVFSLLSEQEQILTEEGICVTRVQGEIDFFSSEIPLGNYMTYTYLMYAFCIVIVFMVLDFWIYQRKREFVILRLNGYSRLQLAGLVGRELFCIMFIVSVFLFLLQLLLNLVNAKAVFGAGSLWNLLEMVMFLIITFLILMLRPFYNIMNEDIMQNFRKAGRF